MKITTQIFGLALIAAVICCKKPSHLSSEEFSQLPPPVFYVTLADTLNVNTIEKLALGNVIGMRFTSTEGQEVRYFEYTCDADKLLDALATSSFAIANERNDVKVREIDAEALTKIPLSSGEAFYVSHLLHADSETRAYECLKAPMKHQLLINHKTNRILHRIVYS